MHLLRALYQFPPLYSSLDGILLRVSCNFVADGAKTEPNAEDSLEVEPLVSRGRPSLAGGVLCVDSAHPLRMLYFIFHDLLQAM